MRRLIVPCTLLLLAACARTEEASLQPTDVADANVAQEILASDPAEDEVALGEWREGLQNEQASLEFGPTGTEPLFSMICGDGRGLVLQRHGTVPIGGLQRMTVTAGAQSTDLAVTASAGTVPMLRAALAPNEPLLGAIAEGQDNIVLQMGDGAPLVLPPSPLLGGFVEGCAVEGTEAQTPEPEPAAEAAPAA